MPANTRRAFLKSSAATGATLATGPAAIAQAANVAAGTSGKNDEIRVGLIGCGGRGSGAGLQTLRGDADVRVVACADAFQAPIDRFLNIAAGAEDIKDRLDVPKQRQFVGLDGYRELLENTDVDLVILATPPGFRPLHYRAAVEAGKHVFTEKPVATDGPGIRETLAVNELAREKGLSVVSGLCWRYHTAMMETVQRIHDGAIGKPLSALAVRYSGHVGRREAREVSKTEFEHQVRNWFFYPWLSGDFCVEQFVHDIDMVCWALNEYPTSVVCTGGRQTREDRDGVIYDHFAAQFKFASGVTFSATTRHQNGCSNPYYNTVTGSDGHVNLMRFDIRKHNGYQVWKYRMQRDEKIVMHQLEHDAMYAALRAGKPLHNGEYMAKSTLCGLAMRDAAYTGKEITIDQMLNSQLHRVPTDLSWDGLAPQEGVPQPGVTEFV